MFIGIFNKLLHKFISNSNSLIFKYFIYMRKNLREKKLFKFGYNIFNFGLMSPARFAYGMFDMSPHEFEFETLQPPSIFFKTDSHMFDSSSLDSYSTPPISSFLGPSIFGMSYMPSISMPMFSSWNNCACECSNLYPSILPPSIPSFGNFNFDYSNISNNSNNIFSIGYNSFNQNRCAINTAVTIPALKNIGYNESLGKRLAENALSAVQPHSTRWCAKYVKNAIAKTGLGEHTDGNAFECASKLANNSHFKEVNVSGNNLKALPAGCVIVYNKNAALYGGGNYDPDYGHIEISLGNGQAASDFKGRIKASDDVRVFVPVSA